MLGEKARLLFCSSWPFFELCRGCFDGFSQQPPDLRLRARFAPLSAVVAGHVCGQAVVRGLCLPCFQLVGALVAEWRCHPMSNGDAENSMPRRQRCRREARNQLPRTRLTIAHPYFRTKGGCGKIRCSLCAQAPIPCQNTSVLQVQGTLHDTLALKWTGILTDTAPGNFHRCDRGGRVPMSGRHHMHRPLPLDPGPP